MQNGQLRYADDTTLLTNSVRDMGLQMRKVGQYSSWGNLRLNISKCAATGMPGRDMEAHAVPSPLSPLGCDKLRQQLSSVKINGQPVPFIHPDKDPQRVLGVLVTPTLIWGAQTQKILEEAKLRTSNITESDASPKQKLMYIQFCLKPYLTYSFPLTYLKNQDMFGCNIGPDCQTSTAPAACHTHRPHATAANGLWSRSRVFSGGLCMIGHCAPHKSPE